jgi:hypothetical protein
MESEIVGSKSDIEQSLGTAPRLFCFPNGDLTATALDIVREHYFGACTTKRGWNSVASDRYLLSRVGVHEDVTDSKAGFLARLSGWC